MNNTQTVLFIRKQAERHIGKEVQHQDGKNIPVGIAQSIPGYEGEQKPLDGDGLPSPQCHQGKEQNGTVKPEQGGQNPLSGNGTDGAWNMIPIGAMKIQ